MMMTMIAAANPIPSNRFSDGPGPTAVTEVVEDGTVTATVDDDVELLVMLVVLVVGRLVDVVVEVDVTSGVVLVMVMF